MEKTITQEEQSNATPGARTAELREKARDQADQYRENAADALERSAETVRDFGDRGKRFSRRAGDNLDDASDYVRSHDLQETCEDMGTWARKHPGPIVAAAAVALGFFCGVALMRR